MADALIEKLDGRELLTKDRIRLKADARVARRAASHAETETSRNELPEEVD